MAFLSVIIAAHNAEATLHATLSSLLAATDQDTEIIIFNDSSEDATQAIIDEWSPKFPQIITRTVNFRNVGRVRNSAVALASGEYITMLDSDDCLKPGSLRDAMAYLKAQRPDMLLTRLLEIRDPRRMTSDLILCHCHNMKQLLVSYVIKTFRHISLASLFIVVFTRKIPYLRCYVMRISLSSREC
jgi:glycosyltransferase involved in cell wall biosynthesis